MAETDVAIITRTKNRPLLLERAILSVLSQTHANWVHVIVNDGGDPGPVDSLLGGYLQRYNGRVKVIHNPASLGMEAASNVGVRASDSRYVTVHDDDDSWEPAFLARCLGALGDCRFPSVKGVVTHTTKIFEKIEGDTVIELGREDYDPHLYGISLAQISEINRFMPISFLFERRVFEEIGLFDESLPVIGDWEFNLRYFMKYDVIVIRENLANYYMRGDSPDVYRNTVTAGHEDHIFYRTLVVNKYMREDIEAGRLGRGMVIASGDYFHRVERGIFGLRTFHDKLRSITIPRIFRRIFRG